jgi:DnaJ-class molecular chaperone
MLGGVASANGLGQKFGVNVPPGTSSHRSLVEAGRGIRCSDHSAGDFVLKTSIKVPEKLSRKQRRILLAYAAMEEPESGVVEGIETPNSHKFKINITEPDKVRTNTLKAKVKVETMSWSDQIRQKLGMTISENRKLF